MNDNNGGGGAGAGTPLTVLGVIFGSFGLFTGAHIGGTLGVAVAGGGWAPPAYSVQSAKLLVSGGPGRLWPGHGTAAGVGIVVLLVLVVAALGAGGYWVWRRFFSHRSGLAGLRELAPLAPKAMGARARALRPSLKGAQEVQPDDTGLLLGNLDASRGPELRGSWEDVVLAVMAPRSNKTTAVAVPAVLRAPGAVLLTSNKPDAFAVTRASRLKVGTVWLLDPQHITHSDRAMWWDMLASARTIEGAGRLASHFIAATTDEKSRGDFWMGAAKNLLTALFHAASVAPGGSASDVLAWLSTPSDRAPVNALKAAGKTALAQQLASTVAGAADTRDGIFETARQCVACLLDPGTLAWVTPDPAAKEFRPDDFVRSRDTLYLLSKDGGGSAAGVIAAAADAVLRAGMLAAERAGGRLDTPLIAVLDEAANVCRIEDLPDLYSHLGSRGIVPVTILQSYRQGVRVWGEAGMDALWSAATVKLLGPGLDDAEFAEKVSRLVGDHKVRETSVSHGSSGRSVSTSRRRERVLEAAEIRALPKGRALLLATGVRVGMIRLRPWYLEPGADRLNEDARLEVAEISARASRKAMSS
ncbi:type IV secretory system conjugative DNA transfer family protein [Streptomyces jumonjinensis]|uniref:Type IV secretory system conjugative DNA transfer family protein n=1 Tax=Streptomyces jumonjinensis TaxID=1945 RepID=A0A646KL26_STRJU|nr:TraM recognition domain-containing protein [Streptomyces jumonjinensis]MQT02915.1 type IV secretory system conjugative DNA transfer family protein [Streptomyces jumonjinensis]